MSPKVGSIAFGGQSIGTSVDWTVRTVYQVLSLGVSGTRVGCDELMMVAVVWLQSSKGRGSSAGGSTAVESGCVNLGFLMRSQPPEELPSAFHFASFNPRILHCMRGFLRQLCAVERIQ